MGIPDSFKACIRIHYEILIQLAISDDGPQFPLTITLELPR